jgi:hypothetical protein
MIGIICKSHYTRRYYVLKRFLLLLLDTELEKAALYKPLNTLPKPKHKCSRSDIRIL